MMFIEENMLIDHALGKTDPIEQTSGFVARLRAERARIQKLRAGMSAELKAIDDAGTKLLDLAQTFGKASQDLAIVTADITRARSRLRGHLQAALLDEEINSAEPAK